VVAVFVAVPAVVYGLPAVFGVPVLVGDNLIQNYPLRVLVGIDVRHGHLPLWDPYLWSGSPLLAGFNAGAAYPGTLLFAVLSGASAWAGNQVVVCVVAATGMVALLRALGRSWSAAALGATVFTYGGFMVAQNVHIDLVQAGAWLPWAFLAVDRLAHRPDGRSATPWVAVLATAVGLMCLTGTVEPILDGAVVLVVYTGWLVWRTPARRTVILLGVVAGVAIGLAVGAAQLLPGAAFQAESQRALHTYAYFTSGSMNKSLTILGLDPLLLGVDHGFPITYFGTYNLPEVSSYIGILPVMALFGLLGRRNRRSSEAPTWWIWYVVLGIGLVLTWGDFTPVGHLLYHLPLFNRQRLLSRNLLSVDLALAVLFAAWIDATFGHPAGEATAGDTAGGTGGGTVVPAAGRPRRRVALTSDLVLALIPVAAVVALQLAMVIGGTWLPHVLHVPGQVTRSSLWPLVGILTVPSAVALSAGAVVVYRARRRVVALALVTAVVVVDLVVFNVGVQVAPDADAASSPGSAPARALVAAVVADGQGPAGGLHRVGFFNPDRFYSVQTDRLGEPDLTILRRLGSIQGYGAIVNGAYQSATDTHVQMTLDPEHLADGSYARLDLGVLVSVPENFLHLAVAAPGHPGLSDGGSPLPPVAPDPAAGPDSAAPRPTPAFDYLFSPPPPAVTTVEPGATRTWYFGTVLGLRTVTVPGPTAGSALAPDTAPDAAGVADATGVATAQVGVVAPDGRSTTWLARVPVPSAGPLVVHLDRMVLASGLVVRLDANRPWRVGIPVVATAGQGTYRLDGTLVDDVTAPRWHFAGMIGVFPVFTQSGAAGRAWVVGSGGPGSARIVTSTPWGDQTITVTTPTPASLVRNVEFARGWQAVVRPVGAGAASHPMVQRDGLVQAVAVPAGTSVVSFTYRPHRVLEGLAVSAVGVIAVLVCALWPSTAARRRRRRSGEGASPARSAPTP
jgi:hypothetical protein